MNYITSSIILELQKQNDRLKKEIIKLKENTILKELYYFFICIYVHVYFLLRQFFNPA